MSPFEYVLIPIAIIMGYAITEILKIWAKAIRSPSKISKKLLYVNSTVVQLSFLFLNFTGLWAYRDTVLYVEDGPLALIPLVLMASPMLAFTLAITVLATTKEEDQVDLEAHYFRVAKPFYLIFSAATLITIVPDYLPGVTWSPDVAPVLVFAVLTIGLALIRNIWLHRLAQLVLYFPILSFLYFEIRAPI